MNKQNQGNGQGDGQVNPSARHDHPSKESVRNWLRTEIAQRRPPPDPAQIRRELGWELIPVRSDGKP